MQFSITSLVYLALAFGGVVLAQDNPDDISPGSPAYNCHAACGGAIEAEQAAANITSVLCAPDGAFVGNYTQCLQCVVQPGLSDIWNIYDSYITADGAICGLNTTPLTAISSAASANGSATASATTSATGSETASPTASATPTPSPTPAATTGEAPAPTISAATSSAIVQQTSGVGTSLTELSFLHVFCALVAALVFGSVMAI